MTRKSVAKQNKNSEPKFIPYVAPKASKKAASSPPASSSSSTSTSVPTNLDLEIVQEVFGLPPNKEMEFEIFDVSKNATINKTSTVILPLNNNNNNNNIKSDNTLENTSLPKDRSKLLDPDEHLEDDDMDEDLKDFTVVTKATPFAVASNIKFTPKEKSNSKIILTINNIFAQNDDFKGVSVRRVNLTRSVIVYFATSDAAATALHVTIPDLKIENFIDFTQYKADMQFNERTIHVTDIPLQMKPANIKQVFAKYGIVTNFRMTVRGMWQHAYITYETPKCIELFYQVWSRFVQNDSVRVNPCNMTPEEVKYRNTHRIKLTNLPFGTTARDLHDIILATKARASYIP